MLDLVENRIEKYIDELQDSYIKELFKRLPVGKRLRAKLILKIAKKDEAIDLAAIIEMIHAASLLHDDVIDDAMTRRGAPSINALYGNKTSIMFGDILYSKAFFELAKFESEIAKIVSNAVTQLSIGELLDVNLTKNFNTDIDIYLDMIYKKTASLIEASAECAAILSDKDKDAYAIYGKNLGLAFQIVDDILDIVADEKKLGKPTMNDFKEGKVTLPYIYLYNALEEKDKEKLKSLFKKEVNAQEKEWIKNKMIQTNSIQKAINYAQKLGNEAINAIDSKDEELIEIMKNLIYREY
ncbi:polyprenyl synthetase family protein [Nitrosophilus kaiyonis]|uniref:polyprenyl synthetase family protein n=1 Tax=Nitrosophilus kaiyonis TaxID=2930200 RepID=UPI0024913E66|nr:polyprenyl synthetase family protein [Nitrosophilus kaiyonis]